MSPFALAAAAVVAFACVGSAVAEPLSVGWAEIDITPPRTVPLVGQHYIRLSDPTDRLDPITATAMALSTTSGEHAVLVSLDLIAGYDLGIALNRYMAENDLLGRMPGYDPECLVVFATHTHTGPYLSDKKGVPEDAMNGLAYREFLLRQLADLVIEAWESRAPGAIAAAQAEAAVGYCRIAAYTDGTAKMYGDTSRPTFKKMEGPHDHTVELLYTWNREGELTGVVVNIASPAQVLEHKRKISADFWHEVRSQLRSRPDIPDGLPVLAMCGAAGDQSPRNLQDPTLTRDVTHGQAGTQAIGVRVSSAIAGSLGEAAASQKADVVLRHQHAQINLPRKPGHGEEPFPVKINAVRIDSAVLVGNPFELYINYGLELKRRSPAAQTFIAQLASGPAYGMYLPTPEAVRGGAYGGRLENGQVGPDGGRLLVERTLELIADLF